MRFDIIQRERRESVWKYMPSSIEMDVWCEGASVIKHAYARDKKLTNDISKEEDDLFD